MPPYSGNPGPSCGLTKLGPNVLVLTGTNTCSGAVTVSGGTLSIGDGSTLGTGLVSPSISISGAASLGIQPPRFPFLRRHDQRPRPVVQGRRRAVDVDRKQQLQRRHRGQRRHAPHGRFRRPAGRQFHRRQRRNAGPGRQHVSTGRGRSQLPGRRSCKTARLYYQGTYTAAAGQRRRRRPSPPIWAELPA